jgi:hypothetical protein
MPEITGQKRTVICAKSEYPHGATLGDPPTTYDHPIVELGVYPERPDVGVQYYVFNADAEIEIDDPKGGDGGD